MAVHLELIIAGPPISNQQRTKLGKLVLAAWKATVLAHVQANWVNPKLTGAIQATIINFHSGPEPSVDVDNMSKPIFDEMQKDVYQDDRQIRQAHLTHLGVGESVVINGASVVLVSALQHAIATGGQFVYIRVEDPVSPYPLPA